MEDPVSTGAMQLPMHSIMKSPFIENLEGERNSVSSTVTTVVETEGEDGLLHQTLVD
jgi:hypothetical protein